MGAEIFIAGASLLDAFMPGISLAAGLEEFEAFPVNPDPNNLWNVIPASESDWKGGLIGMHCAAGDQTFVYDAVHQKAWSEQTSWFKDGMTEKEMVDFMQKLCAPQDVPIS